MYNRRYWREYSVWFLIFPASVVAVGSILKALPSENARRFPLALLPLPGVAGCFRAELRHLRRIDELQHQIDLESSVLRHVCARAVLPWCQRA